MLLRLILFISIFLPANAVFSQTAPVPVQSDMDGDGLAEIALFLYPAPSVTHLLISPVNKPTILAQDFVWRGGIGQEPTLSVAPNGDLRVTSGNQAIGRNRWLLIQTIGFHDGAYRITSMTYNWFDTLDLNRGGTCNLDLVSGTGNRSLAGNVQENFSSDTQPLRVSSWNSDMIWPETAPLPVACGAP